MMASDENDGSERPTDFKRDVDSTTSSMEILALNNLVVSFRKLTKQVRLQIINQLTRKAKILRNKKGSETQVEANEKKAARFLEEVAILKTLDVDHLSKSALANTTTMVAAAAQGTLEERVKVRVATHKLMSTKVKKWRDEHDDWKSLAAFMLSKNTGRRFKIKKAPAPVHAGYYERDFLDEGEDFLQHRLRGSFHTTNVEEDRKCGTDDRVGAATEGLSGSENEKKGETSELYQVRKKSAVEEKELLQSSEETNEGLPRQKQPSKVKHKISSPDEGASSQPDASDSEEEEIGSSEEMAGGDVMAEAEIGGTKGLSDCEEEEDTLSSEEEDNLSSEKKENTLPSKEEEEDTLSSKEEEEEEEDNLSSKEEETSSSKEEKDTLQLDSQNVGETKPSVPLKDMFAKTFSRETRLKPRAPPNKEMLVKKINLDNIDEELKAKPEDLSFLLEADEPAPKRLKKDAFFLGNESDEEAGSSASANEEDAEEEEMDLEEANKERAINSMSSSFIGTLSDRHPKKSPWHDKSSHGWGSQHYHGRGRAGFGGHPGRGGFRGYPGRGGFRGGFDSYNQGTFGRHSGDRGHGGGFYGGQRDSRGRGGYRGYSADRGGGGFRGHRGGRSFGDDHPRDRNHRQDQRAGRGSWGEGRTQGHWKDDGARKNYGQSTAARSSKPESTGDTALHPSWEASRKRKEQQNSIQNFAGKKTTFDD